MIKKLLCMLLCITCLLPAFSVIAFAENPAAAEFCETLENGDYITYSISDSKNDLQNEDAMSVLTRLLHLLRRMLQMLTGTKTVQKTKYVNYYDKNGTLLWTVTLTARFAYSKSNVKCEAAAVNAEMFDPDWRLISAATEKSGPTATARFTVRQTKLGVPLKTIEKTVTLTCDRNGNVE